MPLNPTDGQIAATVAVESKNPILSGYVFAAGLHKPEHSNYMSYRYPQYFLTAMLERLGRFEPIGQDEWSWNEMDRTRKSATVTAETGTGSATGTITTDLADPGYFVATDVIRTETGVLFRVISAAIVGGFQELTVARVDGANIGATDKAVGEKIGHAFNLQVEYSSAPDGRIYLPFELRNKLNILRRSFKISGSEFTNRTYVGDGKSWYFVQEEIEMKEFARDREIAILLGEKTPSGSLIHGGDGLLKFVNNGGVINTYATPVLESDIQDHIKDLVISSPSKEFAVLCGAQFMTDATRALKAYYQGGGVSYGAFGSSNVIGLDFSTYKFFGRTIHFTHYQLFDDPSVFPFVTAGTATKINFSDYSLWLDLGTDSSGKNLITLKYKELAGQQRKLIHAYETGMMSPEGTAGGQVSNGIDGFTVHLLSDIGVEVRNTNWHGILRANA